MWTGIWNPVFAYIFQSDVWSVWLHFSTTLQSISQNLEHPQLMINPSKNCCGRSSQYPDQTLHAKGFSKRMFIAHFIVEKQNFKAIFNRRIYTRFCEIGHREISMKFVATCYVALNNKCCSALRAESAGLVAFRATRGGACNARQCISYIVYISHARTNNLENRLPFELQYWATTHF